MGRPCGAKFHWLRRLEHSLISSSTNRPNNGPSVPILTPFSPGRINRRDRQGRQQPADPRDDGPQRAHRLHHREGGLQDCRDQVWI